MTPDEKAEQTFRDAFDAFQDTPPTMHNHDRPYQAAAAVIRKAIDDAVAERDAEIARLREALRGLIESYCCNVDPYRTGGFYSDPEEDDEIVAARQALGEHHD